ncbi:MAG TPA: hypothetical protein VLV78_16700 [Thermoanaerobaculia bacterium]|nr:hypothetical protein [Thermoanaerobaculia bacterium]
MVIMAMGILVMLFIIRVAVRRDSIAIAALAALLTLLGLYRWNAPADRTDRNAHDRDRARGAGACRPDRLHATGLESIFLSEIALTTDASSWLFGHTAAAVLLVIGLAIGAFRITLAGRPLLSEALLET